MTKKQVKQKNKPMRIEVGYPECVNIDLVQSNSLKHYEIFFSLFSLFATASSGFWVSFITHPSFNKILLTTSLVFTGFTLIFVLLTLSYRSKITKSKIKKVIYL